jgi:CHAT domain
VGKSGREYWPARLGMGLYLVFTVALGAVALVSLAQGQFLRAAVIVAVVILDSLGLAWTVVGVVAFLLLGAGVAALLMIGVLAARLLTRAAILFHLTSGFDPLALSKAASLPGELRQQVAVSGEAAALTTRAILAATIGARPEVEHAMGGKDPGTGAFDGPLIDSGDGSQCTQYAAEAIALAKLLSEQLNRRLDLDLLGAAAAMIPLSAGEEWASNEVDLEDALHVSPVLALTAMQEFGGSPAGLDLLRRAEAVVTVNELGGARFVGRRTLATVGRRRLLFLRLLNIGVPVYAYGAVALELLRGAPSWVASLPGRTARRLRNRRGGKPGATSGGGAGRRRRRSRGERHARLSAPWADWPRVARWLWLAGRPLLTLAAIVTAATAGDQPAWLAVPITVAAATVRSVRCPWLSAAAAAGTFLISPIAAALLLCRVALGEGVIRYLGHDRGRADGARQRGLQAVTDARLGSARRLGEFADGGLEETRLAFTEAASAGGEAAVEPAIAYAAAAWADYRWGELLGLLRTAFTAARTGQWPGAIAQTSMDRELMRLSLLEEAMAFLARWGTLAVAAAVAFATGSGTGGSIVALLATLLVAVPLSKRTPSLLGALLGSGLAWVLTGPQVWKALAIAIATSFTVRALSRLTESRALGGLRRRQRWPVPSGTPRRLRPHWRAASKAIEDGRERIGIDMLCGLAEDADAPEALRAAALGRAALLEVELGRLQSAAARLERISTQAERGSDTASVAAGMLAASLGHFERGERLLREAIARMDRNSPLEPRAKLALCDTLAQRGETAGAVELIAELRARPLALPGLDALLEAEVAIAAAHSAEGDLAAARLRLIELKTILIDETLGGVDAASARRIQRAKTRALLLWGQLDLEVEPREAEKRFGRAVGLASAAGDRALRAAGEVLYGAAMAQNGRAKEAVSAIGSGADVLEERRSQLQRSDHRTAMIAATETVYGWALRGLATAQEEAGDGAGMVAAKLIQSLRQSALAAALRSGSFAIDEQTQALIDAAETGNGRGDGADALRDRVATSVSARFAAVYLPSEATISSLRRVARQFDNVVAFYSPGGGLPSSRIWISAGEGARVDSIDRAALASHPLLSTISETGRLSNAQLHEPLFELAGDWETLADRLLPRGLRERLAACPPEDPERLLIVPDGNLALLPWAALHVGGRPLIESAVLQLAPAIELAGIADPRRLVSNSVLAHLADPGDSEELQALGENGVVEMASSRSAFLGGLESGRFGGAYLAAHGRDVGLRQAIEFADGSTLSAAGAIGCSWPRWTILSSCLVGRVEQVAGAEPLGLPISCMVKGADTVIASVVEISDAGARRICGPLAARLAAGADPAASLRAVQLVHLGRKLSTVADGFGLVAISTEAPRPRAGD